MPKILKANCLISLHYMDSSIRRALHIGPWSNEVRSRQTHATSRIDGGVGGGVDIGLGAICSETVFYFIREAIILRNWCCYDETEPWCSGVNEQKDEERTSSGHPGCAHQRQTSCYSC